MMGYGVPVDEAIVGVHMSPGRTTEEMLDDLGKTAVSKTTPVLRALDARTQGLVAIGAAVHFLDVGGIPVADAKGLETVLRGIKEKTRDDDALLAEAMRILDLFYSAYAQAKTA